MEEEEEEEEEKVEGEKEEEEKVEGEKEEVKKPPQPERLLLVVLEVVVKVLLVEVEREVGEGVREKVGEERVGEEGVGVGVGVGVVEGEGEGEEIVVAVLETEQQLKEEKMAS